jgi:hypothetical protein
MTITKQQRDECPRCGVATCRNPDDKACSDNLLMKYRARAEKAEAERDLLKKQLEKVACCDYNTKA